LLKEIIRTYLVVSRRVAANAFTPDNAGLSPFMQRPARAHVNCVENLPIFGGLSVIAIMTSKIGIIDPLALLFVGARIVQSIIHLISTSSIAVSLRFAAPAVQMAIAFIGLASYSLNNPNVSPSISDQGSKASKRSRWRCRAFP
jgi:uncharacterized MAPEG superfamily protein